MPGLVPGIHVFTTRQQERRGWPGHPARRRASRFGPAMTEKYFDIRSRIIAKSDDTTHRYPYRTDRDPDVVAAGGADGGHRENSGIPTGDDDIRDRRAGGIPDMDRAAGCDQRVVAAARCP